MKKRFLVLAMALCLVFALGIVHAEEATETPAAPTYDQAKHDEVCVKDADYAPVHCDTHSKAATCEEKGLECTLCNLCKKCISKVELDALGHTWVEVAEKAAVCEKDGYKAHFGCSTCVDKKGNYTTLAVKNEKGEFVKIEAPEKIPATGHKAVPAPGWDPALFECGTEHSVDAVCANEWCEKKGENGEAYVMRDKITIKIEHEFKPVKEAAPTCTVAGVQAHELCERCDAILFEEKIYLVAEQDEKLAKAMAIKALGHNLVPVNGTPGACEEPATSDHMACDRKGCDYTEGLLLLPAPGHEFTKFLPEVPATCTEKGLEEAWECSVCGQLAENVGTEKNPVFVKIAERIEIPAKGHAWKTVLGKFATCEEPGVAAHRVCTACGKIEYNGSEYAQKIGQELVVIPAHGHADEDGYVPNTIASPERKGDASLLLKQADMIALGKITLGKDEKPESVDVAPDCDDEGYICNKWCPWCYELRVEAKKVPAKGHTWELTAKGIMPTCEETGLSDLWTCSVCGETEGNEVIAALGHDLKFVDAVPADCEKDGNIAYSFCDREGCVYGINGSIYYVVEAGAGFGAFGKIAGTSVLLKDKDGKLVGHPEDVVIIAFEHGYAEDAAGNLIYDPAEFIMDIEPVAPTCYATGIEDDGKYCVLCNTIVVNPTVIPMTEHVWVVVDAKDPTCTEKGNYNYKYCENDGCGLGYIIEKNGKLGESFKVTKNDKDEFVIPAVVEIAALGHDVKNGVAKDPTCTEKGWEAGTYCDRCGIVLTEEKEIPALGHAWEVVAGREPTCTKVGLKDGKKCSVCKTATIQETIPALGHKYDNYVAEKKPTCTEPGHEEGLSCSRCLPEYADGKNDAWLIYPSVIPALGHAWTYVPADVPTCDEKTGDGHYGFYYCTVCRFGSISDGLDEGMTYPAVPNFTVSFELDKEGKETTKLIIPDEVKVEKLPHTWNEYYDRAPTCTEDGVTTARECKVCHYKESEKFRPATGHSYEVVPGKAATCTEAGVKDGKKCSVCGDEVKGDVIPALGHKLVHVDAKAPNCTEDGNEDGLVCERCDYREAAEIIEALGHDVEGVEWTVVTDEDGTSVRIKRCKRCGEVAEMKPIETPSEGKLGDVNGDGRVNLTDAVCIIEAYVGNMTINEELADFNKDGKVDLLDALAIVNYWTGA